MKNLILISVTSYVLYLCCVTADEDLQLRGDHCKCINYDCGCCGHLKVKDVVDGNLCTNFSYLPDQYGVSATITFNNFAIYNTTVSLKNPPPICVIHVDKLQMEICLKFYDLDVKNKCFSGCAEFEVHFFHLVPKQLLKLGCFGCKNAQTFSEELENVLNYFRNESKYENPEVTLV